MGKSNIPAILFVLSGIFMAVCCFLPIKVITIVMGGEKTVENVKFMPSIGGIVVLGLAIGCAVIGVSGYKQMAALVGTITAIVSAGMMWYLSMSADSASKSVEAVNDIMNGMFQDTMNLTTTSSVETGVGFYLLIAAMVCVLFTGFFYTLVDEN